jgi:hypothetical protein
MSMEPRIAIPFPSASLSHTSRLQRSLLLPCKRVVDTVIMIYRRVWSICIPDITRCNSISLEERGVIGAGPIQSADYIGALLRKWTYPRAFTPVSLFSSRLNSTSSPCTRHVFQSLSLTRVSQTDEPSGRDWTCSAAFRINQAKD